MRALFHKLVLIAFLSLVLAASAWGISLEEAARQAAERVGGRVVSAQTIERDGKRIHVIRVMTRDDVVRTVRIPADED